MKKMKNIKITEQQSCQTLFSGSFFKCKSNDYSSYDKGKIYHKDSIGKYLLENPKDWFSVLDYPTSKQLLECIETGTNKSNIIKALKQWQVQNQMIINF